MSETNGHVESDEAKELLELLEETGARLAAANEELATLRAYRDRLLLAGKESGVPVAHLARAVGMRREQAHYSIVRARADALERALEKGEG